MDENEDRMKPGPKPMEEDKRRHERVSVPVNASEQITIRAAAIAAGQEVAVWARKVLLKAAREAQAPAQK